MSHSLDIVKRVGKLEIGSSDIYLNNAGKFSSDGTSLTLVEATATLAVASGDSSLTLSDTSAILDSNTSRLTLTDASATFVTGTGGVIFPHATVTQATSITTGVAVEGSGGVITTVSSTLAAVTSTGFTVTNSAVTAASVISATLVNYSGTLITNGVPVITVSGITSGAFDIKITNVHASNALSGVMKISFIVV